MGHSTAECWGKCKHCGRYGHRSELCRTKIKSDQAEALKKAAAADARKKAKGKKKNKNAKKVVEELLETLNISSPDNSSEDETSSEDSSGEEGSPGPSVKKVQETPQSRREARAQEFAETISDEKVIETLNKTKMATKVKKSNK